MSNKFREQLALIDARRVTFYDQRYGETMVLLVKERTVIAAGISYCSDKDQFSRKKGRTIALGRAVRAALMKETSMPVVREETDAAHEYKSIYLPVDDEFPIDESEFIKNIQGEVK